MGGKLAGVGVESVALLGHRGGWPLSQLATAPGARGSWALVFADDGLSGCYALAGLPERPRSAA